MIPESSHWSIYSRVGCAVYRYLCWMDFSFFFLAHWHFHPPFSMSFISVFGGIVWLEREKTQICWTHVFWQLSLCELASFLASFPCTAESYITVSETNYFCSNGKNGNSFLHTQIRLSFFFFQKLVTSFGKPGKKNIFYLSSAEYLPKSFWYHRISSCSVLHLKEK